MSEAGARYCQELGEQYGIESYANWRHFPLLDGAKVEVDQFTPFPVHNITEEIDMGVGEALMVQLYPLRRLLGAIATLQTGQGLREADVYRPTVVALGEKVTRSCTKPSLREKILTGNISSFALQITSEDELSLTARNKLLNNVNPNVPRIFGVVTANIRRHSSSRLRLTYAALRAELHPEPRFGYYEVRFRVVPGGTSFLPPTATTR